MIPAFVGIGTPGNSKRQLIMTKERERKHVGDNE